MLLWLFWGAGCIICVLHKINFPKLLRQRFASKWLSRYFCILKHQCDPYKDKPSTITDVSYVCTDLNRFHCWHLICTKVQTHEATCDRERERECDKTLRITIAKVVQYGYNFIYLFFQNDAVECRFCSTECQHNCLIVAFIIFRISSTVISIMQRHTKIIMTNFTQVVRL